MLREIKSPQRAERRISIQIAADATVGEGEFQVSAVKAADGVYDITFNNPFSRAPVVMATARTASRVARSTSETISTCRLHVTDLSGSLADSALNVEVIGWDAEDAT